MRVGFLSDRGLGVTTRREGVRSRRAQRTTIAGLFEAPYSTEPPLSVPPSFKFLGDQKDNCGSSHTESPGRGPVVQDCGLKYTFTTRRLTGGRHTLTHHRSSIRVPHPPLYPLLLQDFDRNSGLTLSCDTSQVGEVGSHRLHLTSILTRGFDPDSSVGARDLEFRHNGSRFCPNRSSGSGHTGTPRTLDPCETLDTE